MIFRKVKGLIHVIEYQKRGLLHAHVVLILVQCSNCGTACSEISKDRIQISDQYVAISTSIVSYESTEDVVIDFFWSV